ncbi:MAG: hypothetical protein WBS24_12990 [Terriglobales bacterium]
MIFGFNTDVRHDDTIYHVQSEARESERLLQTQVFVRGRCIGKRAISYAAIAESGHVRQNPADADTAEHIIPQENPNSAAAQGAVQNTAQSSVQSEDQEKEKMLRELHREVLEAIREGRLDSILDKRESAETLAAIKELDLQWTNADSVHSEGSLIMNIKVTEAGTPVKGARLTLRLLRPNTAPYYAQVLSDAAGNAEMRVQVDEASLSSASVLVQLSFEGRTVTRKFQLRPAG